MSFEIARNINGPHTRTIDPFQLYLILINLGKKK